MSESLHASLMPEARKAILRLDDISWGKFAFDVMATSQEEDL